MLFTVTLTTMNRTQFNMQQNNTGYKSIIHLRFIIPQAHRKKKQQQHNLFLMAIKMETVSCLCIISTSFDSLSFLSVAVTVIMVKTEGHKSEKKFNANQMDP